MEAHSDRSCEKVLEITRQQIKKEEKKDRNDKSFLERQTVEMDASNWTVVASMKIPYEVKESCRLPFFFLVVITEIFCNSPFP